MSVKVTYDVIVVGGGASGLIASGRAAEKGKKVLLLEKNKHLGEKLKISGGGRCNITNAEYDIRELLKSYGKSEQFLYSLFSQFGVKDTFSFFESRGLPLIVEERKRAFPETQKATDVLKTLEKYLEEGKVDVITSSPVTRIEKEGNRIASVFCGKEEYRAENYIFATGGVSHPETGSTGDGFEWLRSLGHTVAKPTPTIVPLKVSDEWVKDLAGISLSNTKITFFLDGKKQFFIKGNILCTHFGLSGPLILNNAYKVADLLESGVVTASIDLFPDMDLGSLEKKVVSIFNENKNKTFKNVLKDIVPSGVSKGILSISKIDPETKVHSITKEDRKLFVRTLKSLPVTISGLMGFDRAVVADGGVALEEIDTKTMKSKKIENLFITGDLLHINRPSGGFSLQLCWSSGYVAGNYV